MSARVNGKYPNPFPNRDGNPSQSIIGTGDIVGPPDPVLPTEYTIDPDGERERLRQTQLLGESFEAFTERATKSSVAKREWLTERASQGKLRTRGEIKAAAIKLGCETREVERQMMLPAFRRRMTEYIQSLAAHATAAALPYQAELAKTDVASFDRIAKIGKVLESGGININAQQNTLIQRNGGDDDNDAKWARAHYLRSSGNLKLVEATQVHDPTDQPQEPDEPETTIVEPPVAPAAE